MEKVSNFSTELVTNREQVFKNLYLHCFSAGARRLARMGAQLADAEDVFQDSLILLYERSRQNTLPDLSNPQAYLCEVSRRLWLRKQRNQGQPNNLLEPLNEFISYEGGQLYAESRTDLRLIRLLELAGKKCLKVLQAFYYHAWSLQEITSRFGFRNVRSATVQKYKCLEKVREKVRQKQSSYETIVE